MSKLSAQELLVKRIVSGARRGGWPVDKMHVIVEGDRVEILPFTQTDAQLAPGVRPNKLDKRLGLA